MKERKQVTLNPRVLEYADKIQDLRAFNSLSDTLETLLREEAERRGLLALAQACQQDKHNPEHGLPANK